MSDKVFIQALAQSDDRVYPLAIAIARALVKNDEEKRGDGIGYMDIHVSEGFGAGDETRYVSITFTMSAPPIDAALTKIGILPDALAGTSARVANLELE